MLNYCGTVPAKDNEVDSVYFFESTLSEKERRIINGVIDEYKDWSFGDLQRLCHEPGSPWDAHYDGEFGTEIPDHAIEICWGDGHNWRTRSLTSDKRARPIRSTILKLRATHQPQTCL